MKRRKLCAAGGVSHADAAPERGSDRHMWYLLFWPVFLCRYLLLERLIPPMGYTAVQCVLDDRIPFCEWFLIPYLMWHVAIVGMHLYTLRFDADAFRKYSRFLIISTSVSTLIFLLFPSCQNLRPEIGESGDLLSRGVELLYQMDTSTNVFPSEHAIGAMALAACGWNTLMLRSPGKLIPICVLSVLICLSTVFLKQHSVLDVLGAVPICAVAYHLVYGKGAKRHGR